MCDVAFAMRFNDAVKQLGDVIEAERVLDEWLAAEPKVLTGADAEMAELKDVLGVS